MSGARQRTGLSPRRSLAEALRRRVRTEQITLDPIVGTVTLGADVEIDPGGIGKGLAADLVVELLLDEAARGALVNVGGDLRVEGTAPTGAGWVVAVTDPTHADDGSARSCSRPVPSRRRGGPNAPGSRPTGPRATI